MTTREIDSMIMQALKDIGCASRIAERFGDSLLDSQVMQGHVANKPNASWVHLDVTLKAKDGDDPKFIREPNQYIQHRHVHWTCPLIVTDQEVTDRTALELAKLVEERFEEALSNLQETTLASTHNIKPVGAP